MLVVGQLVALSRCRSLEGIVLSSPIIGDSAFSSDEVCNYEKGYTPFEQAKGIFDQWKSEYFLEKLCAAFDLDRLRYFYNRVNRVYQVNLPNSFSSQAAAFKEISVPGLFGKPEEFAGIKALCESSRIFIKQLRRMSAEGCTVLLNERIAKAALLGVFVRAIRRRRILSGVTLACLTVAFTYMVSACFGITLYNTAPYLFIFLGLGYRNHAEQ